MDMIEFMLHKKTDRKTDKTIDKLIDKIILRLLLLSNVIAASFLLGLLLFGDRKDASVITFSVGQNDIGSVSVTSYGHSSGSPEDSSHTFSVSPRTLYEPDEGEKVCYLTFDDGPSLNTLSILDILKEYNAKATFFVIGNSLTQENSHVVNRIINEGHVIGLHANNHAYDDFYKDNTSWLHDYETLFSLLRDEYHITADLFRFPGGSACSYLEGKGAEYIKIMHEKGFSCFDWNVSGEDAVGNPTSDSIYKNVLDDALKYNTPVVLLHDSAVCDATVEALPMIMEHLHKEGYSFHTLENRKEYIFKNSRSQ